MRGKSKTFHKKNNFKASSLIPRTEQWIKFHPQILLVYVSYDVTGRTQSVRPSDSHALDPTAHVSQDLLLRDHNLHASLELKRQIPYQPSDLHRIAVETHVRDITVHVPLLHLSPREPHHLLAHLIISLVHEGTGSGDPGGDAVGELGDFGLGGEGEAAEVHSQNALGVAGLGGAAEYEGRGREGRGEGEFLADEIALGVGAVGVEVGVVAEAVLVAGSGEGKIGNSRLAERVRAGEDRESGGERRVEGSHGRSLLLVVTLNPRELASGIEHHLLNLRRSSNWKRHNQSHGVFEIRFEVEKKGGKREQRNAKRRKYAFS
ncbi:hypothetical protein G2W53_013457 [Senna tora]|uniref:Uncharacterized protein n=1 Tax=Senna tora TaxID=362788 RepID=A0A834WSS0_9FABA|nr:hypothetical protein G2W53_013457 [Senna tora]